MDIAGLEAGAEHRSDSWAQHCAHLCVQGTNCSKVSGFSE